MCVIKKPIADNLTDKPDTADDLLQDDEFNFDEHSLSSSAASNEASDKPLVEYQDMQMDEYLDFMLDLKRITEQAEFKDFTFHYAGNAPMMEFAMKSMQQASLLLCVMVLIVIALLWILFESLSAVIWPVAVIMASGFWTIGLASWLGVTLSNTVSLVYTGRKIADAECEMDVLAFFNFRSMNNNI